MSGGSLMVSFATEEKGMMSFIASCGAERRIK